MDDVIESMAITTTNGRPVECEVTGARRDAPHTIAEAYDSYATQLNSLRIASFCRRRHQSSRPQRNLTKQQNLCADDGQRIGE
jgi:hypothetical protein